MAIVISDHLRWGQGPARDFGATSDTRRYELSSAPATAAPITMACWFNSGDTSSLQGLIQIASNFGNNNRFGLALNSGLVSAQTRTNNQAVADSASSYSANVWHHAAAKFATSSSRFAYLDGEPGSEDTNNRAPSGVDSATIGTRNGNTRPLDGLVYWPCVWDVALLDHEILELAKGRPPWEVRPESIVSMLEFYSLRDEADGSFWTEVNGPIPLAEPRRLAIEPPSAWVPTSAPPPVTTMVERTYPRGVSRGLLRGVA